MFVEQEEDGDIFKQFVLLQFLDFISDDGKTSGIGGVYNEDDGGCFLEVVSPHGAALAAHIPDRELGALEDTAFHVEADRGCGGFEFVVTEAVEERGLARVVEAQKEQALFLVEGLLALDGEVAAHFLNY